MYIVKCPLRLSLVGGSTDLQGFIDKFGEGCVISFPCSLYVYVSLHENNRNMLILNYSDSDTISKNIIVPGVYDLNSNGVISRFYIGSDVCFIGERPDNAAVMPINKNPGHFLDIVKNNICLRAFGQGFLFH